MKSIIKIISYIALAMTIVPSFLVFTGSLTLDSSKLLMLGGTIIWFISAPSWLNKNEQ